MNFKSIKKFISKIYRFVFISEYRIKLQIKILIWCRRNNRLKFIRFLIKDHLTNKYHVVIGQEATIGQNLHLPHPHNVVIGSGTHVGENCTIYHDVTLGQNLGIYPIVGSGVIIYTGSKIIGGVTIGDNVIIGANSVVITDIPSNAIVAGIPAKVVRYRKAQDEFY